MSDTPTLNVQAAHRHFAVECFNRAWDLIDKPVRSAEEDEEMLRLSLEASRGEDTPPYCEAYAYEALARAEMAAATREAMQAHLQQARLCAERLRDPETKKMLLRDLESIG